MLPRSLGSAMWRPIMRDLAVHMAISPLLYLLGLGFDLVAADLGVKVNATSPVLYGDGHETVTKTLSLRILLA